MTGSTLLLSEHIRRVVDAASRNMEDADVAEIIRRSLRKKDGFEYVRYRRPDGDIYRELLKKSAGDERDRYIATRRNRGVKDNVALHRMAAADIERLMGRRSGGASVPYVFSYKGYGRREMMKRQEDLELCMTVEPPLSCEEIDTVLWKFFGESPLHVRNPIDAVYEYIFRSRDAGAEGFSSKEECRAQARELLAYADETLCWGAGMETQEEAIPPTLFLQNEVAALAGESPAVFRRWLGGRIVCMDIRDRRYSVRERFMDNLSVVAGRTDLSDKAAYYRLEALESLTGNIGYDLYDLWHAVEVQFASRCGGSLPKDFPDREKWADYVRGLRRKRSYSGPDEPDFLRALRKYASLQPEGDPLRSQTGAARAAQKRLEALMESDSVLQYIVSDHQYACLTDKGKRKTSSASDKADDVGKRISRLTSQPRKIVSPGRTETFDVPRSLFILSELARTCIENGNRAGAAGLISAVNTGLCSYGFPMLDIRRRLDYLIFCAVCTVEQGGDEPRFFYELIFDGLHEIIGEIVLAPCMKLFRDVLDRESEQMEFRFRETVDRIVHPAGRDID